MPPINADLPDDAYPITVELVDGDGVVHVTRVIPYPPFELQYTMPPVPHSLVMHCASGHVITVDATPLVWLVRRRTMHGMAAFALSVVCAAIVILAGGPIALFVLGLACHAVVLKVLLANGRDFRAISAGNGVLLRRRLGDTPEGAT